MQEKILVDTELHNSLVELQGIKAKIKQLEKEADFIKKQVLEKVTDSEGGVVTSGDPNNFMPPYKVSISFTTRNTLKRELLLEQGVSIEQLTNATEASQSERLLITEYKEGE